jgi:ketosteroid isomerase-like protein
MRNNTLISGKNAIKNSFGNQDPGAGNVGLTWEPDFVDVSRSGDLGYTYGKYTYSVTDSSGAVKLDSGIFHTVWKRQSNGDWRFVWD